MYRGIETDSRFVMKSRTDLGRQEEAKIDIPFSELFSLVELDKRIDARISELQKELDSL